MDWGVNSAGLAGPLPSLEWLVSPKSLVAGWPFLAGWYQKAGHKKNASGDPSPGLPSKERRAVKATLPASCYFS
jgi:hypothetical protein